MSPLLLGCAALLALCGSASAQERAALPPGRASPVSEQDRAFWAFQPRRRPPVPHVRDASWGRNAIDAFVLRALEAKGLEPSPEASARELIRRATFDLIGLPPTVEEVEAFVADRAPDAYERLIDRLLAAPAYGERWGRHWLDLVRYAQTNGYERDDEKPYAWRYRDYVIRAFNEDKPYDRFILEQLAGDELEDRTLDSIIATGFYRLGVWDDEPDDKLAALYEELDDIVRTTSETFLGLTVGCARCHEHKFDPIPQQDYYRLLAFFRNVAPYGHDKSATHWEPNPEAIFRPLTEDADLVARWKAEQKELIERGKQLADEIGKLREAVKARLGAQRPMPPTADEVEAVLNREPRKVEIDALKKEIQRKLESPPFEQALSVRELGAESPKTHVLIRGNPRAEGAEVTPGIPIVLTDPAAADGPPAGGRRLSLARWIAGPANPLTARVMANRLWHFHFGRGLVATPSDFGHTGSPPSHPELLDWLASELVDGGWRLKAVHRLIMTSSTYRQSSRGADERGVAADPANALLWRQNLRRLEAEAIRDSILFVSGRLNREAGGRGFFPELGPEVLASQSSPGRGWDKSGEAEQDRRSVYMYLKRTLGVPLMESLDMPVPDTPAPARVTTTVAPQALILLNSRFMDRQAAAFAERLEREGGDPVRQAFRLALARDPTAREQQIGAAFLERRGLGALARMMLNLNEFVYID
jgi:hypothetical protein